MSKQKGGKLQSLIGYRLKVTLNDSRSLVGQLLAFDKHMNLVIAECDEFRSVKHKKSKKSAAAKVDDGDESDDEEEMKRVLGLVILRGETIVTISVEGPPPVKEEKGLLIPPGPGVGAPAGRGMGLAPPTMRSAPQSFPPPGMPGMMGGPPPGFNPPPGFPGAPPPGFQGR